MEDSTEPELAERIVMIAGMNTPRTAVRLIKNLLPEKVEGLAELEQFHYDTITECEGFTSEFRATLERFVQAERQATIHSYHQRLRGYLSNWGTGIDLISEDDLEDALKAALAEQSREGETG
jgi:hypothetical protein